MYLDIESFLIVLVGYYYFIIIIEMVDVGERMLCEMIVLNMLELLILNEFL